MDADSVNIGDILILKPRPYASWRRLLLDKFKDRWEVIRRYDYREPYFLIRSIHKHKSVKTGYTLSHVKWVNVERDKNFIITKEK